MATVTLERPTSSIGVVAPFSWLDEMIARGCEEPFAEVVTVTPALATELLSRNQDNRALKPIKLAQFASDMAANRWAFNGEPIIISNTGELNDGQHRLAALIDAEAALSFMVVFGVQRSTRTTLDQGSARNASDYLAMEGRQYAHNVATIARYVLAYERNEGRHIGSRHRITNAEVLDRARFDEELTRSAAYGHRHQKAARRIISHSIIATAHYLLSKISTAAAEQYLDQVCVGENIERGDPAFAVRTALTSEKRERQQALEIILNGWNRFRTRQQMQRVRINGVFPVLA